MFEKLRKLFDSPEWHQRHDVIDVTEYEPYAIDKKPVTRNAYTEVTVYASNDAVDQELDVTDAIEDDMSFDDSNGWLLLLGRGRIDQYGSSRQVRDETAKLFVKIADYIDGRMQTEGRSLRSYMQKRRASYYYNNPLGDMYDMSYDFIQTYYQGDKHGQRGYAYSNLSGEIGEAIAGSVRALCTQYVKKLPVADSETIRVYRLTPNGLPYQWWDPTGVLREGDALSVSDCNILQNSPSRSTNFWNIHSDVNKLIIERYLKAMRSVLASLDDTTHTWSTKQRRVLERMQSDKYQYWVEYEEQRLPAALLKLAEQSIRRAVQYARPLTVVDEDVTIQRLMPKGLRDVVHAILAQPITEPLSAAMVDALRNSYSQSWKVDAEQATDNEYLSLFAYYRTSDRADKFMNEVLKLHAEPDLSLLALYYLSRQPLKLARQKQLRAYIHPEQMQTFEKLVELDRIPTAALIKELHVLANAPRRTVSIDVNQVERVKQRHAVTVSKLNEYLGEGDDTDDASVDVNKGAESGGGDVEADASAITIHPVTTMQKRTVADMFTTQDSEITFEPHEVALVQLLLTRESGLALHEAKQFAASYKRMLGGVVQALNQKAYVVIEDQFIIQSDDILIIEPHYIEFARKSTTL